MELAVFERVLKNIPRPVRRTESHPAPVANRPLTRHQTPLVGSVQVLDVVHHGRVSVDPQRNFVLGVLVEATLGETQDVGIAVTPNRDPFDRLLIQFHELAVLVEPSHLLFRKDDLVFGASSANADRLQAPGSRISRFGGCGPDENQGKLVLLSHRLIRQNPILGHDEPLELPLVVAVVVIHAPSHIHDHSLIMSRVRGLATVHHVCPTCKLLRHNETPRSGKQSAQLVLRVVPVAE